MLVKASERTALIWGETKISYNKLLENIFKFSIEIKEDKAESIAIFAANSLAWIYTFYAGWKAGAKVIPIDHLSSADETAYIINDCKPDIVYYSEENKAKLDEAFEHLDYTPKRILLDDYNPQVQNVKRENIPVPDLSKIAILIYTSGTTGKPKGVMLTFGNLVMNLNAVTKTVPIYTPTDRTMILLPLHHIFPLLGSMCAPLFSGGTGVFSESLAPTDIVTTLQKYRVSIIIGVPRLYEAIEKGIYTKVKANSVLNGLYNLAKLIKSVKVRRKLFYPIHKKFGGHIRYLVCGGAALNPKVAKSYYNMGFEVLEGYGMSECAPMITFTRPGRFKPAAAGELLDGVEVKFEDGEIFVRGANVMKGYYNKPEETAEVLHDSWLRTGDIGHLDDDGFLFITGRKKELIVLSNGKNITPEECERKVLEISDVVQEVGVFDNDNMLNAIIFPSFAKVKELGILHLEEYIKQNIIEVYNKKVASYKRIYNFTIVKEELPKTRLSKVRRFLLPALMKQDEVEIKLENEPTFKEYIYIKDFLVRQTSKKVFAEAHLEIDLGLDSLDKVSLQTYLENTFGIQLDEKILANLLTVKELAEYVRKQKTKFAEEDEDVNWKEILADVKPIKSKSSAKNLRTLRHFFKIFFHTYFKMKSVGKTNIPDGSCILIANHQSFLDSPMILSFLKSSIIKDLFYYAKEKHLRNKFVMNFAKNNNVIVMDLNSDLKTSLQQMAAILKSGKKLMIFPEGTRTKDGDLGRFKKMYAILSVELGVPILPIFIHGAYDALPSGRKFPIFGKKIKIDFQEVVHPKNHTHDSLNEEIYRLYQKEFSRG